MTKKITLVIKCFAVSVLAITSAFAQLNYNAAGVTNTTGTYTDLGTNGTEIILSDYDDGSSTANAIGFTFSFNGQNFTDFVANSNGFIRLGTDPLPYDDVIGNASNDINTSGALGSNDTGLENIISAFNHDLQSDSAGTAEVRMHLTGTTPNQVLTIQYKNFRDYNATATAIQFKRIEFQIKLYETSNVIEFVYGNFVTSGNTSGFRAAGVGLKGSDTTAAQVLRGSKASSAAWTTTTWVNGTAIASNAHNFRNNFLPDLGRTYRFTPSVANDVQTRIIYTLGKLPMGYGDNHVVQAIVRNLGSTNLSAVDVTLNITGANTFTNTKTISLNAGASQTVSFDPFTPTATGVNTVTVSVPNDDNNSNNTATAYNEVTSNLFSLCDTVTPAANSGIGFGTGGGALLVKYTVNGNAAVNSVNVMISEDANAAGKTVYGIVLNASGTLLAQSANVTLSNSDLGSIKTFTFATPPNITGGDFYAGLVQVANATAYYPVATLPETPGRPNTNYSSSATGGATTAYTTLGKFYIQAEVGAPAAQNDASVTAVYALGKNPVGFGANEIIYARVSNTGINALTNLTISLNVSGANTFTDAVTLGSLAVGEDSLVAFAAFTAANTGDNTVTVSVPADDNNANNSFAYGQKINTNLYSHADTSAVTSSVGWNTGDGILANLHSATGTIAVKKVNVHIGSGASNVGQKVYAVVLDQTGAMVARSTTYTIANSDLNKMKSFTLTTPAVFTDEYFFAGLAQKTGSAGYFPVGTQDEVDGRPDAYFVFSDTTGGTPFEFNTLGRFVIEAEVENAAMSAYSLLSPADGTFLDLNSNASTTPVAINWESNTSNSSTYYWFLDVTGADFSDPMAKMLSANSGKDTTLTLTYADINTLLLNAGYLVTDTANLQWTVRAYQGSDSLQATEVFDLDVKLYDPSGVNLVRSNNISLVAYPNPVSDVYTIITPTTMKEAKVSIYNAQGALVKEVSKSAAYPHVKINTGDLAAGIYQVKITSASETAELKFVKE